MESGVDLKVYLKQEGLGFGAPLFGPVQLPLTLPVEVKKNILSVKGAKCTEGEQRSSSSARGGPDVLPLLKSGKQAGVQNILLRLPSAVSAGESMKLERGS